MRVRLLKDIRDGATFDADGNPANPGTLRTIKKSAKFALGDGGTPVMTRPESIIEFRKGVEVEMSDTSGQKYIDRGVAERV